MTRKRYTEEQISNILKEAGARAKVGDLCRRYGMSNASFYNWKAKYAGLTVSELKRLRVPEEENRRVKQIVVDQALDNRVSRNCCQKTSNARGTNARQRSML